MHGFLKPAAVAREMLVSVGQLRRVAKAQRIPGSRKTKGGQLRFRDCPALRTYLKDWLFKKVTSKNRPRSRYGPQLPPGLALDSSELMAPESLPREVSQFAAWSAMHYSELKTMTPATARRQLRQLECAVAYLDRLRTRAEAKR
jgi:hypothetical protein